MDLNNEIDKLDLYSFDNIINETLQFCVFILRRHLNFDSIVISVIETNRVRWLLIENFSKNLDMSFLPASRGLKLTESPGVVELAWITEKIQVYNSREEILERTAATNIPSNLERVISFSINDLIFQLCRTANLPPFSDNDIFKVKKAKKMLLKMINLSVAMEIMKEQERRRKDACSMLFHDVTNKLSIISGLIYLIDEDGYTDQSSYSLKENVSLLETLFSKFQITMQSYDELTLVIEEVEINSLIDDVIKLYNPHIQKKKHKIINKLHDNIKINTDQLGMKRVIDNLISNAIKYTPDEGKITIQTSIDEKQCKITIIDTGHGISENDLKHVFTKYSPVHQMASRNERGLGLGLWSCQMIMNKLGGEISVYSEGRGKGSSFEIVIPL
ncbi:MAG: HAMP domain-containing histidine kinase [Candidatus Heimdallarchaeota archaeon]|nr:HAMP domain-containing histidine kinase [Candidatus Heimdallarchaeota archaeon]MCK5048556.1 HAMP domain-containing histidine kinase [Candidatus Heimdallarchaeota archaeon]